MCLILYQYIDDVQGGDYLTTVFEDEATWVSFRDENGLVEDQWRRLTCNGVSFGSISREVPFIKSQRGGMI